MDIPRLYKVSALPTSPTAADDGVYFVRPNPSVGYVCYIITNGVAVQQDAVTTAALITLLGDFVKKDGSVEMTGTLVLNGSNAKAILKSISSVGNNFYSFQNSSGVLTHNIGLTGSNNNFDFYAVGNSDWQFYSNNNQIFKINDDAVQAYRNVIVPDATANNQAVNLGQINGFLDGYLKNRGGWATANAANTTYPLGVTQWATSAGGFIETYGTSLHLKGDNPWYVRFDIPTGGSGVELWHGINSTTMVSQGMIPLIPLYATPWHNGNFNPTNYALLSQVYTQSQALALFVGLNGVQTISDTKTFTSSPIVPNGTLAGHTVNLGQLLGFDYQNASQVTAIVNSAVAGIPAPGNGTVVLQGINSLTGTATFSMNQTNNVVGSFDLTQATKDDIAQGVEANLVIPSIIEGVDFFNISSISPQTITIQKKKTIINVTNAVIGFDIEVTDGLYDGYSLAINGGEEWSGIIKGSFRISDGSTGNFNHSGDTSGSLLFWWVASMGQWVQAT